MGFIPKNNKYQKININLKKAVKSGKKMATPFKKYGHLTLKKSSVREKRKIAFKRALWLSFLVIIGALIWITLFQIKNPRTLADAMETIFSLRGIFLLIIIPLFAMLLGIIGNMFLSNSRRSDELIFVFILFVLSALAEIWTLNTSPNFLPAICIGFYLLTKVWIRYVQKIREIKHG